MHGYNVEDLIGKEARQFAPKNKRFRQGKHDSAGMWRRENGNITKTGREFPVKHSVF